MPASLRRSALSLACAVLLLPALAASSHADDEPRADDFEPKARAFFNEIVLAYKRTPSYAVKGELRYSARLATRTIRRSSTLSVSFVRPSKLVLEAGPVRLISDGKTLAAVDESMNRYSLAPVPKAIDFDLFKDLGMAGPLFGSTEGFPLFVLMNLLTDADAAEWLLKGARGMKLEADRTIDGKSYRSLFVDWPRGTDYRLVVDPETRLVSRIEVLHALEAINAEAPADQKLSDLSIVWAALSTTTKAPEDRAFAFTPPAGSTRVDSIFDRPLEPGEILVPKDFNDAVEKAIAASRAMVGKPAPVFTLTVLDGPGKTKKIASADLAGNVVAIVFWETGVDLSVAELAGIRKMAATYQAGRKKVVVAAVSLDDDPVEGGGVRKRVEATLDRIFPKRDDAGALLIALDPGHAVGRAYHVLPLPHVVIIDAKGVVRVVRLGLGGEDREPIVPGDSLHKSLTRDIDALLQGKPAEPPKP